ncbi:hypothetical protein LO762_29665 [Actinocorallia sp. API 0066]|uniref:hypothetical protein n=1 Tax=Actinocorallia sp. API 0066 TaxID=2896846 RepID=UPI001E36EECF|nr:hypothetical protein [Actinocorallia sp. API 0066]MCD0453318.1 hypothetical protein [Actinocorallia sp. API 0066]
MPYLSDVVLPVAFQDQDFTLRAGVHLHWSLPDTLTRLVQTGGGTRVPAVPNRWLVTRRRGGAVEGAWVVESDYAAPVGSATATGIAFPLPGGVPFRRVGRAVPLAEWREGLPGDRLDEVTAVGHGEATFAAFYPGCHSLFGFHDAEFATAQPLPDTVYEVAGWYSNAAQDPLAELTTGEQWREALVKDFAWNVPEGSARPESTVCHAALVWRPDGRTVNPLLSDGEGGVYVGTSATEALAAHLGAELGTELGGASTDTSTSTNTDAADAVENLLEALSFADELEAKPLDVGVGLDERRHADGFRPLPSGQLWTVRREDEPDPDPATRQLREDLVLTRPLGDLLNTLNTAQEAVDRVEAELVGHREQLFADWCRYQVCAHPAGGAHENYPDPDEVRSYLEWSMDRLADRTGDAAEAAATLAAARSALTAALAAFNADRAAPAGAAFVLDTVPAPRFHLPAEPVVLLTGGVATPSDRHGRDGLLDCRVLATSGPRDPVALRRDLPGLGVAPEVWAHNPWNPVLLEWEVEYLATGGGDNRDPSGTVFKPDYVTTAYDLPPAASDLRARPAFAAPVRSPSVYSGRTVLSHAAKPLMASRVLRYLAGTITAPYGNATGRTVSPAAFQRDPEPVLTWYEQHGDDQRARTLVAVYRHLAAHEEGNLAQVLAGFNDALLMRRTTRQLPIDDPLGFPAYQAFAARVAAAVGDDSRHAPEPISAFNPIRAGVTRLSRLRIVDTFGLAHDVDVSTARAASRLRVPGRPGWVAMPPRLAQPARLAFRWLDSDHDLREMNDVPVTSPVCGWLVPDDLNDGLDVYSDDGVHLGLISAEPDPADALLARWRAAPGGPISVPEQIVNAHLRALVGRIRALGPDPFAEFVTALDALTSGIEPEDQSADLFTIRPLAVVRAELDLQLMGPPACHQDWNVFRQDLRHGTREHDGYPEVVFPVRVGAADRLGDGLVGYWPDAEGGFIPVTGAPPLEVSPSGDPLTLLMLVDPRAPVHVVSGVLPAQAVSLPAAQYRAALDRLRVPRFAAPVLTDGDALALPVPSIAGHRWTWREQAPDGAWSDRPLDPVHDDPGPPVRPTAREGWLTLVPDPEH